jgi:hypothetical protein
MMFVRSRRRVIAVVAAAVAAVVGATGCALRGSGYQYVRSPKTGTYLKLPSDWKVKDLAIEGIVFGRQFNPPAGVASDVGELFTGDTPGGFVRVVELSEASQDAVSLSAARNSLFDIDAGLNSGDMRFVDGAALRQPGFRGQHIVVNARLAGGVVTIDQTTFLDAESERLYHLVIGCRSACYERHKKDIETVTESLTLKEP